MTDNSQSSVGHSRMSHAPIDRFLESDKARRGVWGACALYFRAVAGAMPRRLVLAVILAMSGALTEGIALLVLVPLLHLIGIDVAQGSVGNVARSVAAAFGWMGLPLNLI